MFKYLSAQLMLDKLIKRVDDNMSMSKSKVNVPPSSMVTAFAFQDLAGEPQNQMLESDKTLDDENDVYKADGHGDNQDVSDNDDGSNQFEILYTYPQETGGCWVFAEVG